MIITKSNIMMTSQHSLVQNYSEQESLRTWVDGQGQPQSQNQEVVNQPESWQQALQSLFSDSLDLSEMSKSANVASTDNEEDVGLTPEDKMKIHILETMLSALTGKKVKIRIMDKLDVSGDSVQLRLQQANGQQSAAAPQRVGWGVAYDYAESYYESEQTSFSAEGVIKTADGQTINFSTQMQMSRTFATEHRVNIRLGDAKIDPLVVNFSGTAAELSDTKYSFDLDSDGNNDYISFVNPGSGFLVLDKNGDGIINNGTELFGPNTGNGFEELAAYDSDGNGWIDEADAIFEQLSIWTKDISGKDQLFSLADKNVGAILLANISTPFAMKNADNDSLGEVKSSSIFVSEKGAVGTVQQIDLFA